MSNSAALEEGEILNDRYRIVRQLSGGGFAAVYEAMHLVTHRRVAVKTILSRFESDDHIRSMFEREAMALGQIETQYVVQVLDAGIAHLAHCPVPFVVTELLRGRDLNSYLRLGPMSPRLAIAIATHVCLGLRAAHALNIVHRDVKPRNIILVPTEGSCVLAKLIDFGLAMFAQHRPEPDGHIVGTVLYMSPEQARAQQIDHRTDLWSLGLVLYEALSGRRPHRGTTLVDTLVSICTQDIPPIRDSATWVPQEMAAIVDRALRREPDDRFQSADEMLASLTSLLPTGWQVTGEMLESSAAVVRPTMSPAPTNVFVSYASADASFRDELVKHLALLQRDNVIQQWDDQKIGPGEEWNEASLRALDSADIILLLVSADYLASDRLYGIEMRRALDRHARGLARVIPIILRHCDWRGASFSALAKLPSDDRPVAAWLDRDEAWTHVVDRVRLILARPDGARAAAVTMALATQVMHPRRDAHVGGFRPESTRDVRPEYPNEATRALSERIEAARARRRALEAAGVDPSEAVQDILATRRQLREDGQIKAGDSLGDGRFLLIRRIGRGGFATVWASLDRTRDETVAIKVLHANLAGDPVRLERFFRGSRIMAELNHRGVVRILEQRGSDGGWNYFVMEFVGGGDMRQAVLRGQISKADVLPTILEVGGAIAAAHERGIIHRDVKPANILLDSDGKAKLADFDLVCAADTTGGTRTGALGTFVYAAPEILDHPEDADARADVFGLGMTAVFALHGADLSVTMMKHSEDTVRTLDCSEQVKHVLIRAIDWDRGARFSDAGAFCDALRDALQSQTKGPRC